MQLIRCTTKLLKELKREPVANNRSVLGSMIDQKFKLEFFITSRGGLDQTPLYELNQKLNRIPFSAFGGKYLIDRLNEQLHEI